MYSSLSKVDIVVEDGGRRIAVQTDHREPGEIDGDWEISALFALARALNPVRSDTCDAVRFAFLHPPPERLRELLGLVGAEIEESAGGPAPSTPRDDARTDVIAHDALRALGARILGERGIPSDEKGLALLQAEYARRVAECGSRDDDEIGWWTALLELGAAVGEVICRVHGTRWVRDPQFLSMVPYVVTDGQAITNVFGKVERYFEQGASESPVLLLRMHADRDAVGGPVMFNLRPSDWAGRDHALVLPALLAGADRLGSSDIPLVALVRDLPNTVRTFARALPETEVVGLVAEAEANLRALEVQVAEIEGAESPVLVVHGSYYASEKLLDPAFLQGVHARLGAPTLLAAVPSKGQLWLTSAAAPAAHVGGFTAVVEARHADAAPNERLSREVMLVSEGRLVGVARAMDAVGEA